MGWEATALVNMGRAIDILWSCRMFADAMTLHSMLEGILNYLGPSDIKRRK